MMPYHQMARQGLWMGLILLALVPAQALAVGTCREKNCACSEGQLQKGMVDTEQGCKENCNQQLYEDYLRKQQVAGELFEHGQDLRRQADQEVVDLLGDESLRLGGEVASDVALDKGMELGAKVAKKYLTGQRSALMTKAAQLAPAAEVGMSIGGVIPVLDASYRTYDTARRWNKWNDESKDAAARAAAMWQKALADFTADLRQAPTCLEQSRRAAEDERLVEKAKDLIEQWENNQVLYRDPINKEALSYEAALKRALDILKGPRRQSTLPVFLRSVSWTQAAATDQVTVTKEQLQAAATELDHAIGSLARLKTLLVRMIRAQIKIDDQIDRIASRAQKKK